MRFWTLAIVIAGMILASCAKRETEDTTRLEQMALDAWIEKYVTGRGIDVVRQPNGIWVEFIEDGDQAVEAGRDTAVWVQLHYTSTDIDGNVFATRDSLEALRQRTFTPYTYYSPEYLFCDEYNSFGLPLFQYYALRSNLTKPDGSTMKLTTGSHVKLYIPSFLAYGSSSFTNDQGYGGQFPLGENRIMIQNLKVKGVMKNPLEYEEKIVRDFAVERWGKAETDTLAPGFWLDTINFQPRADLLALYPNLPLVDEEGNSNNYGLTADSTVNFWYIGRFLPTPEYPNGFIFDTNIPLIHEEFYDRRKGENYLSKETSLTAISYKPADQNEEGGEQMRAIAAFYRAIPTLRKGQWSRMVFSSSYGYGAAGQSKALQDRQDYINQIAQLYAYSSMYSGMYGGGYGGGYGGMYGGGYGYDPYGYGYGYGYNPYLDYSMSGYSENEDEQVIVTEIPPYSPLMFEVYIEAPDSE